MHQIRGDRPRDLALRQEAAILRREQLDPRERTAIVKLRTEVQEHRDRWALLADVRAQERRGYVKVLTPAPVWNFSMGVWEMRVARIKQPPPAWVQIAKPAALICVPLTVMAGLIWWFLLSLTAASLIGVCGGALLLLAGLLTITRSRGSVVIEQVQRVTIKGR